MLDIDNLPDCYQVKADWYAAIRYASSRLRSQLRMMIYWFVIMVIILSFILS